MIIHHLGALYRGIHEQRVVDYVNVIFVKQKFIKAGKFGNKVGRDFGILDVEYPGDEYAGHSHSHRDQDQHPFRSQAQVDLMSLMDNRFQKPAEKGQVFPDDNRESDIAGDNGKESQEN